MSESRMKIFRVTEVEWIAATSSDDALKAWREYAKVVGYDATEQEEYLTEHGTPTELTEDELNRFRFSDGDNGSESRSFREELEQRVAASQAFPQFFASSEY
jgi:hypothetical protein